MTLEIHIMAEEAIFGNGYKRLVILSSFGNYMASNHNNLALARLESRCFGALLAT